MAQDRIWGQGGERACDYCGGSPGECGTVSMRFADTAQRLVYHDKDGSGSRAQFCESGLRSRRFSWVLRTRNTRKTYLSGVYMCVFFGMVNAHSWNCGRSARGSSGGNVNDLPSPVWSRCVRIPSSYHFSTSRCLPGARTLYR